MDCPRNDLINGTARHQETSRHVFLQFARLGYHRKSIGAHGHDHADHATGASMDPSSEYMQVPDSAYVEFLNLADGDSVDSPFRVEMGAVGMEVRPAGEMVVGTGHHHLLVDMDAMEAGALIPNDETHLHFGLGQTETDVELSSGTHRLTMQFANGGHFSYGSGMSSSITLHIR